VFFPEIIAKEARMKDVVRVFVVPLLAVLPSATMAKAANIQLD
jgi:hypothetical protein